MHQTFWNAGKYSWLTFETLPPKKNQSTNYQRDVREACKFKDVTKSGKKSTIFVIPPPPGYFGLFWLWGKVEIWQPPPCTWFGKNLKWGKFWMLGAHPQQQQKNISLKHLKLHENHFITNLFFVQLKHSKSAFTFGKKIKIWHPPLIIKSPHFELWTFWFFVLTPPAPFGLLPSSASTLTSALAKLALT